MSKKRITAEDAKNKATNFFAHLKHLWKDPVKTVTEANDRRKEVLRILWISLILFCVPMFFFGIIRGKLTGTVYSIVSTIISVPTIIGGIGTTYSVLLCYILKKVTAALKLRECEKCKEIINNVDSVTYEVLKEWVSKKTETTDKGSVHITQDEMALVKISCVCQNCGTPKQFTREFNLAHFLDGELKFSYELDELIEDFMTGKKI